MIMNIKIFLKLTATFALALSVLTANQACGFFTHQPELPDQVNILFIIFLNLLFTIGEV